jgi:hypothetical protein
MGWSVKVRVGKRMMIFCLEAVGRWSWKLLLWAGSVISFSETTTVNEGGSRIPAPRMRNVSGLYTIKLGSMSTAKSSCMLVMKFFLVHCFLNMYPKIK